MASTVDIVATLVWPIRPNVTDFTHTLTLDGRAFRLEFSFPAIYRVTGDLSLAGIGWSRLTVSWEQPFDGSVDEMAEWARDPLNAQKLLECAERAQNALIDLAKDRGPTDFNLECIRHFGPIEWPIYSMAVGGAEVFLRIGSATAAQFRSFRSEMLPSGTVPSIVPFERRTWRRAYDLAQSGYPTEASLLAAAVLDSAVQKFLLSTMKSRGVDTESAKELLRNTMTKRLTTFLDSVLKLATGRSLKEDHPDLFARVKKMNLNRNDAIHNGKELGRSAAMESLNVCREVLRYLKGIKATSVEVPHPTSGRML